MAGLRRRVLKFGGTSVGTAEAMRAAVTIAETASLERPIVVVVSALSGVTNALEASLPGAAAGRLEINGFVAALRARHLTLASTVAAGPEARRAATAVHGRTAELERRLRSVASAQSFTPADRAAVLALGELLCVPVFAAALRAKRVDARELDARQIVRTDEAFGEAEVDYETTCHLTKAALSTLGFSVPVVTGFLGSTADGQTTLLGRGGSDLTAAILAWAIDAERVEIWSDVDGVMSADPRKEPAAETLPRLSYARAAALARAGAKVLHPRTLEPLVDVGIPVFVGNTFRPEGAGTWITSEVEETSEAGTAA